MPRCTHVIEAADAGAEVAPTVDDVITLDETDRRRRRLLLHSDGGIEIMLDLPAVRLLRDGDLLALDDGRLVRVKAQGEALYEIRGSDTPSLLKLVWHIGNRHLATEVRDDHVRIRADEVIRTMLLQLGARVTDVQAGFDPEGGAYGDASQEHAHPSADEPAKPRRQTTDGRSRATRLE